jgi:hypothetical protein
MVEQIPLDGNRERRKYHWKKMFPRCIDDEQYETLPLEYVDAPDFHAPRSAANHEENIATLFETIACIAHSLQPRPDYATHPRRVRSCHDRLIGKRRKPDVVILQDALDVTRGNTHIDWHHVASVGEIKYADSKVLKHDAEAAVVDTSWFALHSTFGRRYVVSFVLCGPVMRLCMVDHGGKVTSIDIDLELQTNAAVQCIIALTMGPDETLGDDKTINAFRVNHGPHNSPTDSESRHTMQFDGRKYHIDARVFLNPSALGRATSIYAAIESTTKSDGTHNNQVAIKDFWPEPTVSFEMDYLKYIHSVLEEKRTAGEPNLPPSTAFPEPIGAELVKCTDPRTGEEVVDSTHLRRRGAPALMYERRIHCRIGFRQVAVDLTWFATRKEFFEALLTSLEGQSFIGVL